jgi:hypothetical protein
MHFRYTPCSASGCHHQGVVVISETTQATSVLWMYMNYEPPSVVSCRGRYIPRQLTTSTIPILRE